jgi:serine/threonine protein kinase
MSQETTPAGSTTTSLTDPFPGEFALEHRLGAGAFGEVWLARDLSPLARQVALKFLRVTGDVERRRKALAVLHNEARVLASLRHPNIVQVHAWREAPASSGPCLVLQYVAGGSLADRVRAAGPLPWQRAARYVADVADGLLVVHRHGMIHRDVKPANMLLDLAADEALLTDFGITARLADSGIVAGTPLFMAPEAFHGAMSPALDVYGLAASLFWLTAGTAPFDGADAHELVRSVERGLPAHDQRLAYLPAPLEALVRAGLAFRADDRPDLTDFTRRLRGALNLLLADCLTLPAAGPIQLRLSVSRRLADGSFVPIARATPNTDPPSRDPRRVPGRPDRVTLSTGDRVRVEVEADQPGHVAVFNVGPSGNLNLLYPPQPGLAAPLLPAGQRLHVSDVELTPPAGPERLFALWTRRPLPLRTDELRSLAEPDALAVTSAYRASRDMVRVQESLGALPAADRHAVVLELDHQFFP